jgi:hypothetical protein
MLDFQPTFRPVRRSAGYLPLEDLGLIGEGATAALVGLDGSSRGCAFPVLTPSRSSADCSIKPLADSSS